MDWAGTAVDYGCFAPVAAFLKAFAEKGLTVTMEEARGPMGMTKIDHIRELFKLPSVTEQFKQNYNRNWTEEDVVSIYKEFEKHLFASLEEYTTPIPGVIEVIEKLKRDGIKIGSTTGYTTAMMDIVLPGAAAHGYTTDNCVTSNNLPAGRPQPYMIYQNMIDLAIPSVQSVIKYGDTIADIKEGVNAGVWTVGVILGSNEMGLTQEETRKLPAEELNRRMAAVRKRMYSRAAAPTASGGGAVLPGLLLPGQELLLLYRRQPPALHHLPRHPGPHSVRRADSAPERGGGLRGVLHHV